ncbi:MAG: hypothetical protein DWQ19_11410 [Crenarchaeota archaeon]|nr:MAG: hypothetical protein DWQ19_11410 [Thermoproteota archaeon]
MDSKIADLLLSIRKKLKNRPIFKTINVDEFVIYEKVKVPGMYCESGFIFDEYILILIPSVETFKMLDASDELWFINVFEVLKEVYDNYHKYNRHWDYNALSMVNYHKDHKYYLGFRIVPAYLKEVNYD